ncbi:hypothetical protein HDU92_006580 [Lobulomyces angularis]|nr:hypothetical protein HDU92_006580 [Lobulomyces angularis]
MFRLKNLTRCNDLSFRGIQNIQFQRTQQRNKTILTFTLITAFQHAMRYITTAIPFLWRYQLFKRFPKTMYTLSSVPIFGTGVVLANAYETHPLTKRGRFLIVDEEADILIAQDAYIKLVNDNFKKFVPCGDPRYKRLHSIAQKLIQVIGPVREWDLHLIDDEYTKNAFVLGNGKIFFYTAMMTGRSDDEIAAILSHEIGHVLSRHSQEKMGIEIVTQIGSTFLHSIVYALTMNLRDLGGAFIRSGTDKVTILPHSRQAEYEADVVGLYLMSIAGYNPRSALRFFEEQAKASPALSDYDSTHPSHENRLIELGNFMDNATSVYHCRNDIMEKIRMKLQQNKEMKPVMTKPSLLALDEVDNVLHEVLYDHMKMHPFWWAISQSDKKDVEEKAH